MVDCCLDINIPPTGKQRKVETPHNLQKKGKDMKTKHLRVALSGACAVALIVAVAFALSSCAGMSINLDTSEKKYLAARAELNLILEQYIEIQDNDVLKVSDEQHERIKIAFISADAALDAWEPMIGVSNYDWARDMKLWLDAKNLIMNILMEVN